MSAHVRLWVEVRTRGELDAARRVGGVDTYVAPAGVPVYGRPQDQLCIVVTETDMGGRGGVLASRLPLRAGSLVPASPAGHAFLGEMRGRSRRPLAVAVVTEADARRALEAGATDVVVADAAVARAIRDAGLGGGLGLIVRSGSVSAAQDALAAGADGLLDPRGRSSRPSSRHRVLPPAWRRHRLPSALR